MPRLPITTAVTGSTESSQTQLLLSQEMHPPEETLTRIVVSGSTPDALKSGPELIVSADDLILALSSSGITLPEEANPDPLAGWVTHNTSTEAARHAPV